jgi:hypothetical protein
VWWVVKRAAHGPASKFEHVGVDHGRGDVSVAEKLAVTFVHIVDPYAVRIEA